MLDLGLPDRGASIQNREILFARCKKQYRLVGIDTAIRMLKDVSEVALDFETTALSPDDGRIRITSLACDDWCIIIDHDISGSFSQLYPHLRGKRLWVYNAKFETKWCDSFVEDPDEWLDICDVDCLAKAKLGGHPTSLAIMCKRDLKIYMDKEQQLSDWSAAHLLQEQLDYAAFDSYVTWRLFRHWEAQLTPEQFNAALFVFNASVRGTIECESTGLELDIEHHEQLVSLWEIKRDTFERYLRKYTPESVIKNLRSDKQIGDYLTNILDKKTLAAWPRTDKKHQMQFEGKYLRSVSRHFSYPFSRWLAALAGYKYYNKYLSTYGENMINSALLSGKVKSRFNIAQAATGRYSSCVAPWTRIPSLRGTVRADEIKVGDYVWTHRQRWRKVTHVWDKGMLPAYEYTFTNGATVTATKEHRVFTNTGWEKIHGASGILSSQGEPPRGSGIIFDHELDYRPDSGQAERRSQSGLRRFEARAYSEPNEGLQSAQVFGFQAGDAQPYARKDQRATSQLARGVRERSRVLDVLAPNNQQESASASLGYGGGARYDYVAGKNGGTPHRRRQEKQQSGQLSFGDEQRASGSTFCGQDSGDVFIAEKAFVGACRIIDFTVEEDHSYLAETVYHHNSSHNLQNIPRKVVVRKSFCTLDRGRVMCLADYKGIEIRTLAELTDDATLRHDAIYGDVHAASCAQIFEHDLDYVLEALASGGEGRFGNIYPLIKEQRSKAKGFTFQLLYGAGPGALSDVLKCSFDEAVEAVAKWAARYPDAYNYRNVMFQQMTENNGYLQVWDGRTIRVFKQDQSLPVAANYGVQGAAASVMYRCVHNVHRNFIDRDLPAWCAATVHDEMLSYAKREFADDAMEAQIDGMEQAWLDIFPGTDTANLVDWAIGETWAAKP